MRDKRSTIDFSKHKHRVEIFKSNKNEIRVDHFQVDSSRMLYIQFINTNEILTVTGDFGSWVFCRPFIPSKDGHVSDDYWLEKLRINSSQSAGDYDNSETAKEIEELISNGLEEYGYEGERLEEAKGWYTDLLEHSEDETEYTYYAYRHYDKPSFIDYEDIPFVKKINPRLNIIFDAFDEICYRLKINKNEKIL